MTESKGILGVIEPSQISFYERGESTKNGSCNNDREPCGSYDRLLSHASAFDEGKKSSDNTGDEDDVGKRCIWW